MKQKASELTAMFLLMFLLTICGVIGYIIGDVILDASNMVRSMDVLRARVGAPLIAIVIGLIPSLSIASWVESKLDK